MSTPTPISSIFKDIMNPDFVVKVRNGEDLEGNGAAGLSSDEYIREDYFHMMLSSKSKSLTRFFLQLSSRGMVHMRYGESQKILAYIDVSYSRLKIVEGVQKCGQTTNGIRFIKGNNYEEIYHDEINVIIDWFHSLKQFCVLSKFRESYLLKNVIGKGNFAKVYTSTHVTSGSDCAVKIFDKKLILQDEYERVGLCLTIEVSDVRADDDESGEPPEHPTSERGVRRRQQCVLSGEAVQR